MGTKVAIGFNVDKWLALEQGARLEMLGDSTIAIMTNLYSHVTGPMREQAADEKNALPMAFSLAIAGGKARTEFPLSFSI